MNVAKILNRIWLKSQSRSHNYFINNIHQVHEVQDKILMDYVSNNKNTLFGLRHNFNKIRKYEDYCALIPTVEDFDEYDENIELIKQGKQHILTRDNVLFFEKTSGSTSASKYIPYTRKLKTEFQTAVAVWMTETFHKYSAAFAGKAYWSVSPPMKAQEVTIGGLRTGVSSDMEYFNPLTSWLLSMIMSVPSGKLKETESEAFYMELFHYLLADDSLSFISVWSPNYFLQLNKFMLEHREQLFNNSKLSPDRRTYLNNLPAIPQWKEMFPGLVLISCWTDAQSALWIPEVEKCTSGINIQSKGLLSTEGVVTIPFRDDQHALAYTSHFFEFMDTERGKVFRAHELQPGIRYEVILTTGGGLYRYNTKDMVVLQKYEAQLPYLTFLGKTMDISDLVGEKVSAMHLYPLFQSLLRKPLYRILSLFIYPVRSDHRICYQLLIESQIAQFNIEIALLVEQHLLLNPYYQQSRASGQLEHVKVCHFPPGLSHKLLDYYSKSKGIKDGDVKLPVLFQLGTLDNFFEKKL